MTRGKIEELEKEAEESSKKAFCIAHTHEDELIYMNGYLASAEPREKQIQIDAEQIRALQKTNGALTDRVKELEAQIEKMQNCRNCKNEKIEGACGHFTQVGWCRDWELAD